MTDYQSPPNGRPPILKVLQMLDAAESRSHAEVLAVLVNADLTIRHVLNLPSTFNSSDIQRLAQHFLDHVQPTRTAGEAAVEDAIR